MMPNRNKIVLIGAGNLATHLGLSLQRKGFSIAQVYSRTEVSARALGEKLQTEFTSDLKSILPEASVYIFSVKDSALSEVLAELLPLSGLFIHTAGSLPMDVFAPYASRYGVLYPLQTFSKDRPIDFSSLPIFIEANNSQDECLLNEIAACLSDSVSVMSSEKRKYLHLAAVFACNFTNHLYFQAGDILEEQGISREVLLPLIQETAGKIKTLSPREAQTGPAVRYDTNVMEKQLELLQGDLRKQEIYRLLSESIYETESRKR